MQEITVNESNIKNRLDIFIKDILMTTRSHAEKLIKSKCVFVNEKLATKNGHVLQVDDLVKIIKTDSKNQNNNVCDLNISILYEDDDILVINKPVNLIVHKASECDTQPTLVDWLMESKFKLSNIGDSYRRGIVHRLDKTTSGAMVIAKNNESHMLLKQQLQQRIMGRLYLCVIDSQLKEDVTISSLISRHPTNRLKYINSNYGRDAKTSFYKISSLQKEELLCVKLYTGRTHQIRVHLSKLNKHIVGDRFYGYNGNYNTRILLHAHKLYFQHPRTLKNVEIYAPIPKDMLEYISNFVDLGENNEDFEACFYDFMHKFYANI